MSKSLNKFKDFYQALGKNPKLPLMKKQISRTHKECLNKKIWPKIFTTNTLSINVYKMCECDKNQCLFVM